jgi:hypothetical protein
MNPYARHADNPAEQTADTASEVDTPEVEVDLGEVDLGEDPFADGLSERLAGAAPRRWRTRTTAVLACLVLLVGGFAGGLEVQKQWGSSATTTATARPGGGGFGQGGAGYGLGNGQTANAGTAANTTTGTVKLVDGNTIYITTSDGRTITVKTSGSTTVQTSQGGSLSDLSNGSSVTVQGQTGSDGSISASTITKAK